MPSLLEALEIKRKMFFEFEGAPYHALDVEVSRPTARGGQTLVRIKMRNLLTQAVFDKTFKAGDKFQEPDLAPPGRRSRTFQPSSRTSSSPIASPSHAASSPSSRRARISPCRRLRGS